MGKLTKIFDSQKQQFLKIETTSVNGSPMISIGLYETYCNGERMVIELPSLSRAKSIELYQALGVALGKIAPVEDSIPL